MQDCGITTEYAPPFDIIFGSDIRVAARQYEIAAKNEESAHLNGLIDKAHDASRSNHKPKSFTSAHGLSKTLLVGPTGLEPMTSTV